MSRRRDLSDEEHALWRGFARSITPLRPGKAKPEPVVAAGERARNRPPPTLRHAPPPPVKSPPLAPLDRRFRQRVARGHHAIDARIDLHGMTQTRAHAALFRFLRQAQADGARIALVVTGKGAGGAGKDMREDLSERGVLRRQVPIWLTLAEFRPFVIGFDEAHLSHGGQGALYVRLRRAR